MNFLRITIFIFNLFFLNIDSHGQNKMTEEQFYSFSMGAEKKKCYELIKNGNDQELFKVCHDSISKKSNHIEVYYAALIYYHNKLKNKDDSIFKYIDLYLDEGFRKYHDFGEMPYDVNYDYRFLGTFCFNNRFEEYVLNRIKEFYLSMNYPKKLEGLKILKLAYLDQKTRGLNSYKLSKCEIDSNCKEKIREEFISMDKYIQNELIGLINMNGEYFTSKEIGRLNFYQNVIFWHVADIDLRKNIVLPIIEKAFIKGAYTKEAWINQKARTKIIEGEINRKDGSLDKFIEEECKKYNCDPKRVVLF